MKLKKWDTVLVIAGSAKWKKWKIQAIIAKNNQVILEWVNIKTKYRKTTAQNKWSMIKIEYPIDASNVMALDSKWSPSKIWYKFNPDWKKYRVTTSNWEPLENGFTRSKKI